MRIKLFEQFVNEMLNERAVSTLDMLSNVSIGVIVHRALKSIAITVYDFKDRKALAWIEAIRESGEPFQVTKSAADKGYGPAAYDFLLMEVHPDGVMPDRESITGPAQKIWFYYFDHRDDVEKMELKDGDPGFADFIKQEDDDISDPEVMRKLNTVYKLKPTKEYEAIKQRTKELAAGKEDYLHRVGKKLFTKYYWAA